MNLRISEKQLRFRITRDELLKLMDGEKLESYLDLGDRQSFSYCIFTGESDTPLAFDADKGIWRLKIAKTALAEFAVLLPSRDGIEYEAQFGSGRVMLILEVDVRRGKNLI